MGKKTAGERWNILTHAQEGRTRWFQTRRPVTKKEGGGGEGAITGA